MLSPALPVRLAAALLTFTLGVTIAFLLDRDVQPQRGVHIGGCAERALLAPAPPPPPLPPPVSRTPCASPEASPCFSSEPRMLYPFLVREWDGHTSQSVLIAAPRARR